MTTTPDPRQPAPKMSPRGGHLTGGNITTLMPHRLPEFSRATDSFLANEIIMSKDYRRVAAALVEYTIRNGVHDAVKFNGRLFYGLTDPSNEERSRFEDIASCWFPVGERDGDPSKPN